MRREQSWQVYRFDYWRWHGIENLGHGRLEEDVFIWETTDGRLASVLNPEGPGQVYLQVHPGFRTRELEEEMLVVAEERLATTGQSGGRKLWVWAQEDDDVRQGILEQRGYARVGRPGTQEYQRRRALDAPLPDAQISEGYTLRALGDVGELPARSYLSWRAFHPDAPDDEYDGWQWYQNVQRAPLYRRDLDIVAVAPDGGLASFCTIWFDDVARTGAFEPVGTDPAHQRRGLGRAVMGEGLRRLTRLGATMAYVGSYETAAHGLYASVGFTEFEVSAAWEKEL
jgi:GNAT superfamily N-acetyltransferase